MIPEMRERVAAQPGHRRERAEPLLLLLAEALNNWRESGRAPDGELCRKLTLDFTKLEEAWSAEDAAAATLARSETLDTLLANVSES